MPISLPSPIAAYFATDKTDGDAIALCFTPEGAVKDEGHVHRGRAAIRQWRQEASTKYTYVIEPFAVREENGRVAVTARVTGNFPGSPIDLTFAFTLEGQAISYLEIGL